MDHGFHQKGCWKKLSPAAIVLLVLATLGGCSRKQDDALLEAARNGDLAISETVIAQGARVNVRGEHDWTPLMWASFRGNDALVRLLLEKGADIHLRSKGEVTALMWAALEGQAMVVETLLAHGADVNAKDRNGNTALMAAAYRGKIASVKLLLKHGAEINTRDGNGNTALILTVKGGYIDTLNSIPGSPRLIQAAKEDLATVVKLLLDSGADRDVKGADGRTALSCAEEKGETGLVALLRQPTTSKP